MTLIQILLIITVVLALGITLRMIGQAAKSLSQPQIDIDPGFRNVGTFGSLRNFSGEPRTGRAP